MVPTKLKLSGFKGIKSGVGKDEIILDLSDLTSDDKLVAFIGHNGAGKTTIIDNLHPYRLMPSYVKSYSPSAFSYWDHVYGTDAEKELEWRLSGEVYRSTLLFRNSGKTKKTEAFLHKWSDGTWEAVKLPDGTISDGKTETYDRCVDYLAGSPELYFTSAFAAQSKRPLSSYTNGEIKELMAELLGIEKLRSIGKSAMEVVKGLNARLSTLRTSIQSADELSEKLNGYRADLASTENANSQVRAHKVRLQTNLVAKQTELADLKAKVNASAESMARRSALEKEISELQADITNRLSSADADVRRESERVSVISASIRQASDSLTTLIESSRTQIDRARQILSRKDAIAAAGAEQSKLNAGTTALEASVAQCAEDQKKLAEVNANIRTLQAKLEGITRDGTNAAKVVDSLKGRVVMMAQVPCAGQSMQATCPLMQDAVAANNDLPAKQVERNGIRNTYRACEAELNAAMLLLEPLNGADARMAAAQNALNQHQARLRELASLAALATQVQDAEATIKSAETSMANMQRQRDERVAALNVDLVSAQAQLLELEGRKKLIAEEGSRRETALKSALDSIRVDDLQSALAFASDAVDSLALEISQLDISIERNLTTIATLKAAIESAENQVAFLVPAKKQEETITNEIAKYTLLGKAFGNDGIVALSIDDAGPTLASITNDLLLKCYGTRFTVSIATQEQNANGSLKEGFDVIVHDADRDQSKSIIYTSGGERVWINECLIRSIAIYQSHNSGNRFDALFSDESDGPLDVDKKMQFMKMKREVLRIGGYEREFFISHTPALWELADKVIDVTSMQ